MTPTEQTNCPNCGTELHGQYCYRCGQHQKRYDQIFWKLLSEALGDLFRLDSTASRTLFRLFFRPGTLTVDYIAGKRARYIPPISLYLVSSLLLFFLVWLGLPQDIELSTHITDGEIEKVDGWIDTIDLDGEDGPLTLHAREQISTTFGLITATPGLIYEQFIDLLAPLMLILLPVYALILKLFYIRSHRYYTEHLLLTVYNQSFLFLSMVLVSIGELVPAWIPLPIQIWIFVYMYMSLITVYGQGHLITIIKFCGLFILYYLLFSLGLLVTFSWQVLTL